MNKKFALAVSLLTTQRMTSPYTLANDSSQPQAITQATSTAGQQQEKAERNAGITYPWLAK